MKDAHSLKAAAGCNSLGAAHPAADRSTVLSHDSVIKARPVQRRVAERIIEAWEQRMPRLKSSCHIM